MLSPRAAVLTVALLLSACSSSGGRPPNAADREFLQDMASHHQRAIDVAGIGARQGSDPRVRAFARRIVAEQTPELQRMRARAAATHLTLDAAAGARMATERISDADVARLRALRGAAFDRLFVSLNIRSETGAAAMARTELADGVDAGTRGIAKPISGAPTSEIPELRALLTRLGGA